MTVKLDKFFNVLSDATRLRALLLIVAEGELCVCELTYALRMIQPKVSRHLALLHKAGIVASRRQGQWIYYRLERQAPTWELDIITTTLKCAKERKPYVADRARLATMPNRPNKACCV